MKWARLLSLSLALLATGGLGAAEPSIHLLWPEGAPGALGDAARDKPRLLVYLPEKEKANGSAIVICPVARSGTSQPAGGIERAATTSASEAVHRNRCRAEAG